MAIHVVMRADPRHSLKLAACLGIVYLAWGSGFLISKIAVAHLPAALLSGTRFVGAGALLALIARYGSGDAWPADTREWRYVAILGVAMVFLNNGLNVWAIQFIPSNQSALLNGTAAFWIAGMGTFGPRGHPLSRWAIAGLVVGFIGTALLLFPKGPVSGLSLLAQAAALAGTFAWSLGTLYYRSVDTSLSPLMTIAFQMLIGGALLLGVGFAGGEAARWSLSAPGLISLGYLTLCSSCLGYAAYGWLVRNTTPAVLGTYSYVNPAIAAFLGWQFLHEELSRMQRLGMVIVLVGVLCLTLLGRDIIDAGALKEPPS